MLLRHSALYMAGRIIPGVVSLLTLAAFTRILTPDQYGLYTLVIAASAIVNAFFFQWLNLSLGRFLQAHDHKPGDLLSTALSGYVVLVVASGIIGCATARFWPDRTLRWLIILTVVIVWAQAWYDLNLKILNARLAPVRYGVITSAKALLAVGIGLALFYLGLGVAGVLFGLVLGLLFPSLFVWRHWQGISIRACDARLLKAFINYGAPLTVTFMLTIVLDSSDRFLLGWYLNAKAVGVYAAVYILTQQSLGILMGAVHLAAFPLAIQALEDRGASEARVQLGKNIVMLLLLSVPATVGLLILSNNIAAVVLGHAFQAEARNIIMIVAVGTFVGGVQSYYLSYSFQLARKMRGLLWTLLWAAFANVGLNLWWIPKDGVIGAAYATLGGYAVGAVVSWYLGRRVFALPPLPKEVYKVGLAALGMAAILFPTVNWRGPIALLEQVSLGCFAYTLLLIMGDVSQSRVRFRLFVQKIKEVRRRQWVST